MKKHISLLFLFAFCLCMDHAICQDAVTVWPVANYTAAKLLDKKVWELFSSTNANGFVMMSVQISNGRVGKVGFSKNFPVEISSFILETLKTGQSISTPKGMDNITLLWPILYQYDEKSKEILDIFSVIDAFDFQNSFKENKGAFNAVVMPVCMTGFTKK